MQRKRLMEVLVFGLLIGLLAGCGSTPDENGQQSANADGEVVAGEVVPTLTELGHGRFEYKLKNQTEEVVEFEFTSGQRYDYALLNQEGEQVFLYSSVASFIQALGEEKLKPGEELVYEIDVSTVDLKSGTYTLEVWFTPKSGKKYKVSTDYIVESKKKD